MEKYPNEIEIKKVAREFDDAIESRDIEHALSFGR